MGCMGMSMEDFCRCAPSEFYAAWKAYSTHETRLEQGAWERMRMECLCTLQPYSKKRLRAQDVMVFPWEKAERKTTSVKTLSHEDMLKRYEEMKRQRGLE